MTHNSRQPERPVIVNTKVLENCQHAYFKECRRQVANKPHGMFKKFNKTDRKRNFNWMTIGFE